MSVPPGPLYDELPLDGVKVLDLSQMVAGPACCLWLADYGAEVIKIEPLDGDGGRSLRSAAAAEIEPPPLFAAYNRNKQAMRLDLRTPAAQARVWELLEGADVVVASSTPGAMARLGFAPDTVRGRFPRLVYASVSGFGQGPAGRVRRGVDLIVQAESGMMALTGYPEGPPTKVGFTVIDTVAGHALCHGVLAALFRRSRTGVGATISISLFDVALNMQNGPIAEYLATGVQPPRWGNSAPHTSPADVFACADGDIVMAAYLPSHWERLMDLLGDPALAGDGRFSTPNLRVTHRRELFDLLSAHFLTDDKHTWLQRLRNAGLLAASVNDFEQVLEDEVTEESGVVMTGPEVHSVRSPVRFDGTAVHAPEPLREVDDVRFTTGTT